MKEMITIKAKNAMEKELKAIHPGFEVIRTLLNCGDGKVAYITYKNTMIKGTKAEITNTVKQAREIVYKYQTEYAFEKIEKIGFSITDAETSGGFSLN